MATELERPTHYVIVQANFGHWLSSSSLYLFFGKNLESQIEDLRKQHFASGARTCSCYPHEITYLLHPDLGNLGALYPATGMLDKVYTRNTPADKTVPYRYLRFKDQDHYWNYLVLRADEHEAANLVYTTYGFSPGTLVKNIQFLPEPGLNFLSGYKYNRNQSI